MNIRHVLVTTALLSSVSFGAFAVGCGGSKADDQTPPPATPADVNSMGAAGAASSMTTTSTTSTGGSSAMGSSTTSPMPSSTSTTMMGSGFVWGRGNRGHRLGRADGNLTGGQVAELGDEPLEPLVEGQLVAAEPGQLAGRGVAQVVGGEDLLQLVGLLGVAPLSGQRDDRPSGKGEEGLPAIKLGINRGAGGAGSPLDGSPEEIEREPGLIVGPGLVLFGGAGEDLPPFGQPVAAVRGQLELGHGPAGLTLQVSAPVLGLDLAVGVPERRGAPGRQRTQLPFDPLPPSNLDLDPRHLLDEPAGPRRISGVEVRARSFDRPQVRVDDGGGQAMLPGILPRPGFPLLGLRPGALLSIPTIDRATSFSVHEPESFSMVVSCCGCAP